MVEAIRYIIELTMWTYDMEGERGERERERERERETFTEHECKHYYTVIKSLTVTGVLNVFTSSPTH